MIKNMNDLRTAYSHINLFAQYMSDPSVKEYCDNLKREIRAYNAMLDNSHDVIISEDMDHVVELCEIPDGCDPEVYFAQNIKRYYIPRSYDCTGQLFTIRHKIFTRRGKPMCYHIMGIDC